MIWAYMVEVILAIFTYGLIFLFWDFDRISAFFIKTSGGWGSKFTAIMLAGSIAFFWTFYSHSNTDFAKWLYLKKAYNNYLRAFLTAITVFLLTTISFLFTQATENKIAAVISGGLLILSVVNVFSFFKNIVDIMKLNIVFNIKLEQEKRQNGG